MCVLYYSCLISNLAPFTTTRVVYKTLLFGDVHLTNIMNIKRLESHQPAISQSSVVISWTSRIIGIQQNN